MAGPARNPFEVLGLPANAPARDIERAAQKQLAMIAAGLVEGAGEEASHEVRWAVGELRDPRRRLALEVRVRNLCEAEIAPDALEPALRALEAALPRADDGALALAEEILWRQLSPPPPYRAPEDHESEKLAAMAVRPASAPTLLAELPWAELTRFDPPTRPEPTKKKERA